MPKVDVKCLLGQELAQCGDKINTIMITEHTDFCISLCGCAASLSITSLIFETSALYNFQHISFFQALCIFVPVNDFS